MNHYYGMRLRGCSLGAQPLGFSSRLDPPPALSRYYDILEYPFRLSNDDVKHYSLDYLGLGYNLDRALIKRIYVLSEWDNKSGWGDIDCFGNLDEAIKLRNSILSHSSTNEDDLKIWAYEANGDDVNWENVNWEIGICLEEEDL